MSKSFDFEKKFAAAAAKLSLEPETKPASAKNWSGQREPQPQPVLLDATVAWLNALPPRAQPRELAKSYPRIANRLCELWKRPAREKEYLDELLVDHRGNRKGFPLSIAMELTSLRQYYDTVFPFGSGANDVWQSGI